jgi:hypothetical protein
MELVDRDHARDFLKIVFDIFDVNAYRCTLEKDLTSLPYFSQISTDL